MHIFINIEGGGGSIMDLDICLIFSLSIIYKFFFSLFL